jgi:hypothetical protein
MPDFDAENREIAQRPAGIRLFDEGIQARAIIELGFHFLDELLLGAFLDRFSVQASANF